MSVWFPYLEKIPTNKRCMLCLPHAGSGASIYRGWIDALKPEIVVVPIQLPARESRYSELMPVEMNDLVSQIVREISPMTKFNEVTIFGHSFGGLVAFECAKALQDRNIRVVISAAPAPNSVRKDQIHHFSDEDFLRVINNIGGMPSELSNHWELLSLILPTLKIDIKLSETYYGKEDDKVLGDLLLISGKEDKIVTRDHIKSWCNFTRGKFKHVEIEGDHFYHLSRSEDVFQAILDRK